MVVVCTLLGGIVGATDGVIDGSIDGYAVGETVAYVGVYGCNRWTNTRCIGRGGDGFVLCRCRWRRNRVCIYDDVFVGESVGEVDGTIIKKL